MSKNNSGHSTLVDKTLKRLKNNPVVATVILISMLISAVAGFLQSYDTIVDWFRGNEKPAPEGKKYSSTQGLRVSEHVFVGERWDKWGGGSASVSTDAVEGQQTLFVSTYKGSVLLACKKDVNLHRVLFTATCRLSTMPYQGGYGMIFGFKSPDNYLAFGVNNNKEYRLFRIKNGVPESLLPWTSSALIPGGTGKHLRLGVTMDDGNIVLLANGQAIDRYRYVDLVKGRVGFYADPGSIKVFILDAAFQGLP